MTGNDRAL